MSHRGQGSCPQCKSKFFNRYKPEKCQTCGFHLGGSYQPKAKKQKMEVPQCVLLMRQGSCQFYSCRTVRNHRCFFVLNDDQSQCHYEKCKLSRAAFMNSNTSFTCDHIIQAKEAVEPLAVHSLSKEVIDEYKGDHSTKEKLTEIMNAFHYSQLIQLSPTLFSVYGLPTSSNPIGFVHVTIGNGKVECSSSDCKGYGSVMRQQKNKKICIHCHILLCFYSLATLIPTPSCSSSMLAPGSDTVAESPSPEVVKSSSQLECNDMESETLTSRQSTIELNMLNTLPYQIPRNIFDIIALNDSRSIDSENGKEGWPVTYCPECDCCRLCGSQLSIPRPHPGQKTGAVSYLLTNGVPFLPVTAFVKLCLKTQCKAMHQVFPFDIGLFNISDKLLVSLDILLELRESFKRGVPLTVAIESKLAVLLLKAKQIVPSREYITDLMYNGFYCFELLTVRSLDEQICGICGVLGEVYLGDGNQKNCCSVKEISYAPESRQQNSDGHPLPLNEFLQKIRCHFVECNTYTRPSKPLNFHVSEIPPVVAPKLSGKKLWNTEMGKKSQHLKKQTKAVEGDPALLHVKIRDCGLELSTVPNLSLPELKKLASELGVSVSHKSKQCLVADINQLYAILLVGNSPCHEFTKIPGQTGGFYHIVCRHGVTVISKCLALQESVRDAADLFLSLKYPPLLFICDTPCGFVRHMDCREPDVGEKLWGKFSGCFEVPDIDKSPSEGVSVPHIVPSEYRANPIPLHSISPEDHPLMHPLSGECRRYVLGDRFHSASNPHKSPLCLYHNINLSLQANTIKTSYQEVENNRKNTRRLRSACVQGFGVHFLYNYLMDFYQNEHIVTKQLDTLMKKIQGKGNIVRDEFMRYIIVSNESDSLGGNIFY